MKEDARLVLFINRLIFGFATVFFFLFPLFFLPFTTEFSEYNKLVLVILTSGFLVILWLIKSLVQRKFVIASTHFDLPFALFVLAFLLSTWFSVSRYTSLLGKFNSWHWTAVEMLAFIGLFYALVTNVRSLRRVGVLLLSFLASSTLVALAAIGSYLGIFSKLSLLVGGNLPGLVNFLKLLAVDGFSPAGSLPSVVLLLLTSIIISAFLVAESIKRRRVLSVVSFFSVTALLLGGLLVWLVPYYLGWKELPFVRLGLSASWRIASSTIRDYPLFGTGLSTYSSAYSRYRPALLNRTEVWDVIFDRAGNEYMTWLTTLGIVGFFTLLLFVVKVLLAVRCSMEDGRHEGVQDKYDLPRDAGGDFTEGISRDMVMLGLRRPLALGVLAVLIIYLFVSSTVLTTGVLFILLILWMLVEKERALGEGATRSYGVEEVVLSFIAIKERLLSLPGNLGWIGKRCREVQGIQLRSQDVGIVPWFISLPLAVVIVGVGFHVVQDFRSNLVYARSLRSLSSANQPAREIYNAQQRAINLNPRRDAYHRAYAETNISLARAIAAQKGETITKSEREDVVTLVQQAVREARVSTEILNPVDALSWQLRGRIYSSLLGVVMGADRWAVYAYQNAINLAPTDPKLRVDLGSLYYTLAVNALDSRGLQGEAPGEEIPQVPQSRQENLVRAETAFLMAIRLKPDYANAHYNLAAVYREAGRYELAQRELETTLRYLEEDSVDYLKAQQELERVKKLVSEGGSE